MKYLSSFGIIAAIILSAVLTVLAQPTWMPIREEQIVADPGSRVIVPQIYRLYRLDFEQMQTYLRAAPDEQDYIDGAPGLLLNMPLANGELMRFEVWEAPVMHPDLGAAFPDIRSFAGKSVSRKGLTARFDITPAGFHAMIFNPGGSTVFIDPYARGNTRDYLCYFRKDFIKKDGARWECHVADEAVTLELPPGVQYRAGDCGNRREYRLALACTGEYANYHGAYGSNKAPALAAMVTSMTRVNGVFERDCGLRMVIIPNDTAIIFTDPANDPYTNGNGSAMLNQNQATCDSIIGTANYDIGHVFSTGGGGVAVLNSPCSAANKAKGVTGLPDPVGDPFDIDYVAHEIGHQYGAQHTQYNDCNRSNASAMEPGSASTIMGYAGICAPNVQNNSDDYFHARSLQQIGAFATSNSGGNACATPVATGNSAPVVAALANYSVPRSTPLVLSGSATDPNNDPLTYCWEQMNAFTSPAQPMPPQSTNTSGPVFRSLQPTGDGSRYLPNFPAVLANTTPTWEVLPSVARSMSFRLTVRDNNPLAGCTSEANMTVTTVGSAGPFQVTSPNGGESYPSNSMQTITWNVAGTTASPISCTNVEILISTNGGNTFTTLVASTPNDGSENVVLSAPPTTQARILIRGLGNIFYDVSDNNFTITAPLPVELTAFTAHRTSGGVQLRWTTATERDNTGFRIERSIGEATAFVPIGWVDGRGYASEPHIYVYMDATAPPGERLYYRLRQIDRSGNEQLSPIRMVPSPEPTHTLALWPNPASDRIYFQLPQAAGVNEERLQVFVMNITGEVVQHTSQTGFSGEIPLSNLPFGMYCLRVASSRRTWQGYFFHKSF
ncbi:MAG: M12 family metallo-peptidase [Saprospiraceae bacterium]|nr:M12 family metallo-peptidase [Saprospiraceae bacterium]